ncbi:TPA: helix-turn-helix domain-containing protein, partial [Candidatus Woesearchaeota archaeon]|nr:helix-turn-helix domain-containing protein [Candidatus Woesearchaeota archaeon]
YKVSDLRKTYGTELDQVIAAYGVQSRADQLAGQRDSRMFEARDLYEQGLSMNNIARKLGVSKSTVQRDIKKAADAPYLEMTVTA